MDEEERVTEEKMRCIGFNIKRYRKERHWTQNGLAIRTGYQRTYISALERGRVNPTLRTLVRVALELGVDTCYLLIDRKKIG